SRDWSSDACSSDLNRVVNWTYSNNKARVDIEVSVAYNSDIRKVQEIILQSAKDHPLCALNPVPICFLRKFNDSGVDFLLYLWIEDILKGRYTVQSEVMFTIWDRFKEHNIEIPFPQRDINIKSSTLPLNTEKQ